MHQQTSPLFYKFRFVSAGIFTVVLLVLTSALVTAMGSNSVLDTRSSSYREALDTGTPDDPNIIVNGAYGLVNGARHAMISAGATLYGGCRSITTLTAQSGTGTAQASAATLNGLVSGSAFVIHGIGSMVSLSLHTTGSGVMFTLRTPGKLVGAMGSGHAVGAIIRPDDDKPVPVISSETSAAILVHLSAQQQQQIASLQAAQLAANRSLGGSVVAGDPQHGGYPLAWDTPLAQDSRLDSWGMYNRECVSYAAWKVYQTYGHMPYWGGVGNANQWVGDAKAASIPTGSTPQVHAVAIDTHGYYGHAMWVEAVNGDMIYVSQYNYNLDGRYSEMWVNGTNLTYIYFK
jgi:surface antigen